MNSAWSLAIIGWATIAVYNLSIVKILTVSMSKASLKEALREKDPAANAAATALRATQDDATVASADNTSYSRVAGMIGATVMACFLWALGNITIYFVFAGRASEIQPIMSSVGTFFLAGASLFAPYGFNQLKETFKG